MDLITITYTPASQFVSDVATQQICSTWNPANTASDNAVFADTYYQTNVWEKGTFEYASTLEAFLASQVAHPGLVAALRAAVRAEDHTYEWEAPDGEALYIEELNPALKDQGFELTVGGSSSSSAED